MKPDIYVLFYRKFFHVLEMGNILFNSFNKKMVTIIEKEKKIPMQYTLYILDTIFDTYNYRYKF